METIELAVDFSTYRVAADAEDSESAVAAEDSGEESATLSADADDEEQGGEKRRRRRRGRRGGRGRRSASERSEDSVEATSEKSPGDGEEAEKDVSLLDDVDVDDVDDDDSDPASSRRRPSHREHYHMAGCGRCDCGCQHRVPRQIPPKWFEWSWRPLAWRSLAWRDAVVVGAARRASRRARYICQIYFGSPAATGSYHALTQGDFSGQRLQYIVDHLSLHHILTNFRETLERFDICHILIQAAVLSCRYVDTELFLGGILRSVPGMHWCGFQYSCGTAGGTHH